MHLDDALGLEAGALEMAIDIRGVDKRAMLHPRRPSAQDRKASVRGCIPIEIEAMSIEAPGQLRGIAEPAWAGQGDEVKAELRVRRIRVPEPVIAAEIRHSGIDAHARAGADQQRVRAS